MTPVIMHTIGIVSILWAMVNIIQLWVIMNSFEVKYLKRNVTIKPHFFLPFVGGIFYIVWFTIG
jgi:hypothetical protein